MESRPFRGALYLPGIFAFACWLFAAVPVEGSPPDAGGEAEGSTGTDAEGWIGAREIAEELGLELHVDHKSEVYVLSYQDGFVRVAPGISIALINNETVMLPAPPRYGPSDLLLPAGLLSSIRRRIGEMAMIELDFGNLRSVVLDPGHGGKDPGGIGTRGTYEKTIVLDVARRCRRILRFNGISAHMTRATDVFIPLQERSDIANRLVPNVFVSIHANIASRSSVDGVESFVLASRIGDVERAKRAAREPRPKVLSGMRTRNAIARLLRSSRERSRELADCVQSSIARLPIPDRGVKEENLHVLRETYVPSILIEVGFLSNPEGEALLCTPAYRQKLAEQICRGLAAYGRDM